MAPCEIAIWGPSDCAHVLAALEAGDAERMWADYRDPFPPGMNQATLDDHRAWLRKELGSERLEETQELVAW